jgi:hypothetical protein
MVGPWTTGFGEIGLDRASVRVLLLKAEKPLPALPLDKDKRGARPGPFVGVFPMGVELGTLKDRGPDIPYK